MAKEKEIIKLSTTVNKKFDDTLRRHVYLMRINQNEVLDLYQNAYLEKCEQEKNKKKAERENKRCEKCEQLLIN